MAEPFEHHGAAPDLADRVGDAFAGNVGRAAVHRLEQARELAVRIDVGAGCDADGAGAGGAEVGQDVAEQVAGNDHIEERRTLHEVRGEDIDVKLFVDDLRSSFSGLVVETITKEQAFQLLKSRNPDLASLVENTGENPLPDSLRIDGIPLDLYESVDAKIESKKNMLNYDKDIMNRKLLDYKSQFDRAQVIVKLLRTIEYGVYALLTLFIFTVAVIVYMVIGNSVFFHRQEIEIIELVGGKRVFVY